MKLQDNPRGKRAIYVTVAAILAAAVTCFVPARALWKHEVEPAPAKAPEIPEEQAQKLADKVRAANKAAPEAK